MGQVIVKLAGREHIVTCRDGEETHLLRVAALADRHSSAAARAANGDPQRTLLLLTLLLADQLDDAGRAPAPAPVVDAVPPALLEQIANRLEAVASALEQALPEP